jgi:hypothetical protein
MKYKNEKCIDEHRQQLDMIEQLRTATSAAECVMIWTRLFFADVARQLKKGDEKMNGTASVTDEAASGKVYLMLSNSPAVGRLTTLLA